jgi:intracellular sulfur oxidation DsrE/DsrF family protein
MMCRHIKKFITVLLLFLATSLIPQTAVTADSPDDEAKVVYHADFSDPRRFSAMLTSINNMVTHYQNELIDYDVRIVFVAHGIRFLTDNGLAGTPFASDDALEERRSNLKGRLSALNSVQGVKLELCDITRAQIKLSESKLYGGVEAVPSGVVRLVELQSQGFAYIKIE